MALHCSLAHGGAWEGVARGLSDRFAVTAPDLVGHGAGPARDTATDYHDQVTAQALAYLHAGTLTHLIGHSFGATVALRLAIERPELAASLTLIEPVFFAAAGDSPGQRAHASAMTGMDACLDAGDSVGAARRFLSLWGGGVPFDAMPPAQQAYMAERIWVIPASHAALFEDHAGLLPRLGEVKCPVLLLEGAASPPVIAEIQSALASAWPRAHRQRVDGAGHMLPITHAKATAAAIGAFLPMAPAS